ncbi:class I SAM-dependent methyltransferase [Lysobacter panacisoli]|uniref:Class I SAM-dependent methyltransferase n=1 Tax=Lysobacter panacisoli TaxID=1255263 RepID=A0ABP9L418_9GAMM|nr:class I SAM-dependent methyltransferase [Lysobacter panacisoli]
MPESRVPARPRERLAPLDAIPACAVCGGDRYRHQDVLWQGLVDEWALLPDEVAYVNRQQGTVCERCGCNIRSIALGKALCIAFGREGTLDAMLDAPPAIRLLEVNEAGTLHWRLGRLSGHVFGSYPDVDLQAMAFDDASFDAVVHSDTLEHVPDPQLALAETLRVLRPGGAAIFTVPIVMGRMSVLRTGLGPSYHGDPSQAGADLIVHTEFGADTWAMVLQAGFTRCEMVAFDYPAGIAIIARR